MSRPSYRAHPPPPGYSASRALYPSFLSLQDTARIQLACARKGLIDAFRWDTVIWLVSSDAEVRANVFKSLLLNSLSLASISFFDFLLLPLAQGQKRWLHRHVGWAYQLLWLLPVVGASFYLNNSWCTLLAKRTFTLKHGTRAGAAPPSTYTGMLNALAASAYGAMMVLTLLITSFLLAHIPIVGRAVAFAFFCWVDAYYCFEFVWIARGLSLARRVRHLEERWAYYFAFGLPSAALCMWGSSLANAALFALLFPAYIIMAMHAHPVPLDPYNPLLSKVSSDDDIRHPSPLVPIRLPIFAIVLWLNDWVVRILSVGGGRKGTRGAMRHQRALSDITETVEDGDGQAHEMTTANGRMMGRVRMGVNRRKLD